MNEASPQTIDFGKQKLVIEKCLNESGVRLETQSRDFWNLYCCSIHYPPYFLVLGSIWYKQASCN